jgi:hypothetical protein
MKLHAIRNHIIFQFVDDIDSKGQFVSKTSSGFILPGHYDSSAKEARWAKVISAGPECDEVLKREGCEILIAPLRWTKGSRFDGQTFWRTDQNQVLGYKLPE